MRTSEQLDRAMVIAGATVLLLTLLAGEAVTVLIFGLGCAVAENVEPHSVELAFCSGPWLWLPAVGALAAIAGYLALIGASSTRGFWLGSTSAVLLGGALWLLWGDPAGSVAGLFG